MGPGVCAFSCWTTVSIRFLKKPFRNVFALRLRCLNWRLNISVAARAANQFKGEINLAHLCHAILSSPTPIENLNCMFRYFYSDTTTKKERGQILTIERCKPL